MINRQLALRGQISALEKTANPGGSKLLLKCIQYTRIYINLRSAFKCIAAFISKESGLPFALLS